MIEHFCMKEIINFDKYVSRDQSGSNQQSLKTAKSHQVFLKVKLFSKKCQQKQHQQHPDVK